MNEDQGGFTPEAANRLLTILEEYAEQKVVMRAPVKTCREVLWMFGERELGQEPSGFMHALYELAAKADEQNLLRLVGAFPEAILCWHIGKRSERGLAMIRAKVVAYETIQSARFGMPFPSTAHEPGA